MSLVMARMPCLFRDLLDHQASTHLPGAGFKTRTENGMAGIFLSFFTFVNGRIVMV